MAKAARLTAPVALDDLAVVVHEDEVGHADLPEVHAERVHPEVIGALGIAGGDVAGHAFVEAEAREQPEGAGEALLAMQAFFSLGAEGRRVREHGIHRAS